MSNFLDGLEMFNDEPKVDFTPEFRVYYNEETGDIVSQVATEYQKEPPPGTYIVLSQEEWKQIRPSLHKVIDGTIKTPEKPKTYNLVPSDSGYGTKKNNPYFIGDEEYYEFSKRYV